MPLKRFRTRTLAVIAVSALTITGTAFAATVHPHANKKYGGTTSEAKTNGKKPTVTFKTSKNGKQLLNFAYQTAGCFTIVGGGSLNSGLSKQDVGTIAVGKSGSFSRKNVTTKRTSGLEQITTTSTVTGHFKKATVAVGTIVYKQTMSGKGVPMTKPCGPEKVTFTATQAKPAPSGGYGGYGGY